MDGTHLVLASGKLALKKLLTFFLQVLLTALRFNNKAVAQIASDMLLLLADHVKNFLDYYPEVPKKIIEVLARYDGFPSPFQRLS